MPAQRSSRECILQNKNNITIDLNLPYAVLVKLVIQEVAYHSLERIDGWKEWKYYLQIFLGNIQFIWILESSVSGFVSGNAHVQRLFSDNDNSWIRMYKIIVERSLIRKTRILKAVNKNDYDYNFVTTDYEKFKRIHKNMTNYHWYNRTLSTICFERNINFLLI